MEKKIVHTELDEIVAWRFNLVKSSLGLKSDGEVIRYLITNYYTKNFKEKINKKKQRAQREYEKDIKPILKDFMSKYSDQWKRLGEDD